jgi:arylsulfatase A-like enzyme
MRVVVVSARGLRPGALGLYGNAWVETPALDALAARSVVFDGHFADRADAAGARRAWRTGRFDLPGADGPDASVPEAPDLVALLRGRDVHTCLIVDESRPDVPGFTGVAEFTRGWDEVRRVAGDGEGAPLERVLEEAETALRQLAGRDGWLVWLDLATPLPPWDVPEEFLRPYFEDEPADEDDEEAGDEEDDEEAALDEDDVEQEEMEPPEPVPDPRPGPVDAADDRLYLGLWQTYAAAMSYIDAGIGQLLEAMEKLEKKKKGTQLVFVFTADCGLPLGEHGVVGAVRAWAHEERLRAPLVLYVPGVVPRRVDALTQAVDLAPTLAGLFGVPLPGAHGHDLAPLARGEAQKVRDYVCAGVEVGGAVEWCLRTDGFAFLLPVRPAADDAGRVPRLYVKPDDRWEVNDVVQHYPELADRLPQTLRDFVAATRQAGPLVSPPLPAPEDDGARAAGAPHR